MSRRSLPWDQSGKARRKRRKIDLIWLSVATLFSPVFSVLLLSCLFFLLTTDFLYYFRFVFSFPPHTPPYLFLLLFLFLLLLLQNPPLRAPQGPLVNPSAVQDPGDDRLHHRAPENAQKNLILQTA